MKRLFAAAVAMAFAATTASGETLKYRNNNDVSDEGTKVFGTSSTKSHPPISGNWSKSGGTHGTPSRARQPSTTAATNNGPM